MNLIPESNGLKKLQMKEKLTGKQWLKGIAIVFLAILVLGFLTQTIISFIGNQKVRSRLNYAKVEGQKMEYKVSGSGDYTIVFDGAIGGTLYEWNQITKTVEKQLGVQTFVYNRNGYGFSDISGEKTIDQQAQELKILLRKAGVSGKLILVGEGYGSLVLTSFAKQYPESVSGMVYVQPYEEEKIKTDEFRKDIRWQYYKSKIESTGTTFGLTRLLDTFNIAMSFDDFQESLPKGADEEYAVLKNQKAYRKAIADEFKNIYKYSGSNQEKGLLNDKALYIITSDKDTSLADMGNKDNTTVYDIESEKQFITITDPETVVDGISSVVKDAKRIDKKSNQN